MDAAKYSEDRPLIKRAMISLDSQPNANAGSLPTATAITTKGSPLPRRALGGLLVRKDSWRLSLAGKFLVLVLLFGSAVVVQRSVYPFLAVTHRVPGEYVVVEGWLQASSLRQAWSEFQKAGYRKIFTTGSIARNEWDPDAKTTYAEWGASKLQRIGVPADLVQPIPCYAQRKDRTYHSALAAKAWFTDHGLSPKSFNIITEGAHARRTRLLFQKAFGKNVTIGVIAIEDHDYDPNHWWRTSEGVRDVIGETVAYLYARIFFHPSAEEKS